MPGAKPVLREENPVSSQYVEPPAQPLASPELAVVIPTLREAETIGPVLDRVRDALDPLGIAYELVVVDDDSRDGTELIVGGIATQDPRVRWLVRRGARGLSGAIAYGWRHSQAGILGVIDADLQHPPELLGDLWAAIQAGADLAIASRYSTRTAPHNWSRFRQWLSHMAIWPALPLLRPSIHVSDPMSGFFLLRRRCIEALTVQPEGFKILLEILVRGQVRSVTEVPFVFGTRQGGTSKASIKVGLDYFRLLTKLWAKR
jgi:dolichol-phosphate mannosyltransferase